MRNDFESNKRSAADFVLQKVLDIDLSVSANAKAALANWEAFGFENVASRRELLSNAGSHTSVTWAFFLSSFKQKSKWLDAQLASTSKEVSIDSVDNVWLNENFVWLSDEKV